MSVPLESHYQRQAHVRTYTNTAVFTCSDGVSVPAVFVSDKTPSMRYRVLGMLGRGAFGRCYKVQQLSDPSRPVWACKAIDRCSFKSQKMVDRVKYEVRVMRALPRHENVVQLHRIFQDSERIYIAMELCTPRTIHDLLQKRKRLTEFESRYFIGQVASGLAALHSVCIIHRDIKHSNLLLDSMNRVKIADFGLSTILDIESDRKLSFLGTPNFLAPELVTRDGTGHSFGVDMWATGVLLYIMLYGRAPFSSPEGTTKADLRLLYGRIVENNMVFPKHPPTSYAAKLMIQKLCCKREEERIEASQIFGENWFLANGDTTLPEFMPESIFHTPIHSIHDYRALVADTQVASRPPPSRIVATLNPKIPATKHIDSVVRRSRVRQPLEPIIEHENQARRAESGMPRPILRSMRQPAASVDTSASTTRVGTDPVLHERIARIRDKLHQRKSAANMDDTTATPPPPPSSSVSTRRYALRSKDSAEEKEVVVPAREIPRSVRWSDLPRHTADSEPRTRTPGSHHSEDPDSGAKVQAEFGQAARLSEDYLPSLKHWHGRLCKFLHTVEQYRKMNDTEYEAWLARTSWADIAEVTYPRVGMYVLNWMMLTKYGLGFRLSDRTIGTIFNDHTSLLHMGATDDYAYVRPYKDRSCVGYYAGKSFPTELEKKRTLLGSFERKIQQHFSCNVDTDICPYPESDDVVRCLLQALATEAGMVFLLTGGILQFSLLDHAKLFLYEDSHIFYKDAFGKKWHFDLVDGPARLLRDETIDVDQFLLCVEFARKVLATDKFTKGRESG